MADEQYVRTLAHSLRRGGHTNIAATVAGRDPQGRAIVEVAFETRHGVRIALRGPGRQVLGYANWLATVDVGWSAGG